MLFRWLLILVPISWVLEWVVHAPPVWVFITSVLALMPLADLVRKGTEELSNRAGSAIGGLLNVSFGNAPELIVALFILRTGEVNVVKAQITGAIIGNSLLALGLAAFVGGWGKEKQEFNPARASQLGSLLLLSVIALILPALFDFAERPGLSPSSLNWQETKLSVGVAIVLIVVYIANLVYTLCTHKDMFAAPEEVHHEAWPLWKSLGLMLGATVLTAVEAEILSGSLEAASSQLHLSKFFIGVIILAVAGNIAEYFSALYFAKKDKMGLVVGITLGSTIQIALLMAPLLVLLSPLTGHRLDLVFTSPLELVAIAGSAFVANAIAHDGQTTWFEGLLLIAVYVLFGMGFFFATRGM